MGKEKFAQLRVNMILYNYSYYLAGVTFVMNDGSWLPKENTYEKVGQKHVELGPDFNMKQITFKIGERILRHTDIDLVEVCDKCLITWPELAKKCPQCKKSEKIKIMNHDGKRIYGKDLQGEMFDWNGETPETTDKMVQYADAAQKAQVIAEKKATTDPKAKPSATKYVPKGKGKKVVLPRIKNSQSTRIQLEQAILHQQQAITSIRILDHNKEVEPINIGTEYDKKEDNKNWRRVRLDLKPEESIVSARIQVSKNFIIRVEFIIYNSKTGLNSE